MSSPSGIALVRNALSSGPLTGEPSARFVGSITVKLLRPTEACTPAKAGSAWISSNAEISRFRFPSQSLPMGAMPGSMMQSSLVLPGQRSWNVGRGTGRLVGLLRGAAGPGAALDDVLGNQQDRLERRDAVEIEHARPQGRDRIEDRLPAAGASRVIGFQARPGDLRVGRVDRQRLGRHALDLPHQVGHELGRAGSDVHVDVGGPFLVLAPGQLQQPRDVARVESFFVEGTESLIVSPMIVSPEMAMVRLLLRFNAQMFSVQ